MEIYRTKNKNIFYTFVNIDNKQIELDFVLTVPSHFYCDVFIQNRKNVKEKTYLTVQQYNFNDYNFVIPQIELEKIITSRQIILIKKAIKKAYYEILKIKWQEIYENHFCDNYVTLYEDFRKHIDHM